MWFETSGFPQHVKEGNGWDPRQTRLVGLTISFFSVSEKYQHKSFKVQAKVFWLSFILQHLKNPRRDQQVSNTVKQTAKRKSLLLQENPLRDPNQGRRLSGIEANPERKPSLFSKSPEKSVTNYA